MFADQVFKRCLNKVMKNVMGYERFMGSQGSVVLYEAHNNKQPLNEAMVDYNLDSGEVKIISQQNSKNYFLLTSHNLIVKGADNEVI